MQKLAGLKNGERTDGTKNSTCSTLISHIIKKYIKYVNQYHNIQCISIYNPALAHTSAAGMLMKALEIGITQTAWDAEEHRSPMPLGRSCCSWLVTPMGKVTPNIPQLSGSDNFATKWWYGTALMNIGHTWELEHVGTIIYIIIIYQH